jgi:hypothetical protein
MNEQTDIGAKRLLKITAPNGNVIWIRIPDSPKYKNLNGKQIWQRLPSTFKLKATMGALPVKAIFELGKEAGKSMASTESLTKTNKAVMNRKDASAYLDISPWTLDRLRKRGLVRACGGTRTPKYQRTELDRYLEENSF